MLLQLNDQRSRKKIKVILFDDFEDYLPNSSNSMNSYYWVIIKYRVVIIGIKIFQVSKMISKYIVWKPSCKNICLVMIWAIFHAKIKKMTISLNESRSCPNWWIVISVYLLEGYVKDVVILSRLVVAVIEYLYWC